MKVPISDGHAHVSPKGLGIRTVAKKFKQKDFARNVKRDRILLCEEIGIPKEKFFEICLEGLKKIGEEIGL